MKHEATLPAQRPLWSPETRLCFPATTRSSAETEDFAYLRGVEFRAGGGAAHAGTGLSSSAAAALGQLLPMLLCGEESAVLVFKRASRRRDNLAREAAGALLSRIAGEEDRHSRLLALLLGCLPLPEDLLDRLGTTRTFFRRLRSRDSITHFARIAALDGCVCQILSALLHAAEIGKSPLATGIFTRIRAEEGGHVRFSRRYVLDAGYGERHLAEQASAVREALVGLLTPAASSFDRLGTDPDRLFKRLRRV